MLKQFDKMEHSSGKWTAAIMGIIGGMAKYIHLILIGDVVALNKLIEPAITAAICGFMGVLGKQLYKWATQAMRLYIRPWLKSLLTKKR